MFVAPMLRESAIRKQGIAVLMLAIASVSMSARAFGALDRCTLLTDAEIEEAIGPHLPGNNGLPNEWGNNSCRWTAKNAPATKAPEGWRDAIEVGVFDGPMLSWGKEQVRGEPIAGVTKNAMWEKTYGELWFDCAGGRVCVVKVRTAASKDREAIAAKFARLVDGRVR